MISVIHDSRHIDLIGVYLVFWRKTDSFCTPCCTKWSLKLLLCDLSERFTDQCMGLNGGFKAPWIFRLQIFIVSSWLLQRSIKWKMKKQSQTQFSKISNSFLLIPYFPFPFYASLSWLKLRMIQCFGTAGRTLWLHYLLNLYLSKLQQIHINTLFERKSTLRVYLSNFLFFIKHLPNSVKAIHL